MRILKPATLALMVLLTACSALKAEKQSFFVMDTIVETTVVYEKKPEPPDIEAEMRNLERLISVTDEKSELYGLNNATGAEVPISGELYDVLGAALYYCDKTGGNLNIAMYPAARLWGFTTKYYRVPGQQELENALLLTNYGDIELADGKARLKEGMAIDLGAVGKGYALSLALETLKQNKSIKSALINAGGDVMAYGGNGGKPWRVALSMPEREEFAGILEIVDLSVATSGNSERYFEQDGKRYHHILDPKTGRPAESGLSSVTIVCKDPLKADAYATALFVMGMERGLEFWRAEGDFDIIFIAGENVYYTPGLSGVFTVDGAFKGAVVN